MIQDGPVPVGWTFVPIVAVKETVLVTFREHFLMLPCACLLHQKEETETAMLRSRLRQWTLSRSRDRLGRRPGRISWPDTEARAGLQVSQGSVSQTAWLLDRLVSPVGSRHCCPRCTCTWPVWGPAAARS